MKTFFPIRAWGGVFVALLLALPAGRADEPAAKPVAEPREQAERLLEQGKFAEAQETFEALPAAQALAAALGVAHCQEATGARDKAVETLNAAVKTHVDAADLHAELARLALERGDDPQAATEVELALKHNPEQLLALWVRAELLCNAGKLAEANVAYEQLVKFFNEHEVKDAERLRWIGLAAAQFARWNRVSDQFSFLVNEFYPDLLVAHPDCWWAQYESGRLFAEKFNQADSSKAFKAALVLNPNAAEIHAALGHLALEEFELAAAQGACDRALEINPQLLAARHLQADIHLANFEPRQSLGVLTDALKLNPHCEETLGRMAAACASIDGLARTSPETRFGKLVAEVNQRNAHAGRFYLALADALDRLRRWPAAARYYEQAMQRMPQLVAPSGQLGMVWMRLGEEDKARVVLDEAFKIDPFNVRVNNTLKVLELLAGYQTLETEHFRIRHDGEKDGVVARYMGQWLEEVYPELVQQMGFAPPEKSLFEVFSRAKNTDGHGWFSARMVGLPHIHPIGACAGKIVALQSPADGQQRFNWARVIKHEFVHVINLQQTDFNIPHWFTEALAVLSEGYPRPQAWNDLLAERWEQKKLFDLETINLGFIRPHSSDEWTLAYCQASLYAQFMRERYGEDAIAKMLAAYNDNLTTPAALTRALGVKQAEFEQGYRDYVQKIVASLPPRQPNRAQSVSEAQRNVAKNPRDIEALATLAQSQLDRANYPQARRWTDAALAIDPRHALASYVRARLHLVVGENKEALARLEGALDRDKPQENLLALLAALKFKSEDYATAAELYELGAKKDPTSPKWLKSLAAVYLKSDEPQKLIPVLTKLAAADADDFLVRKKLAQLYLAENDPPTAARWALEALHINVMDAQVHQFRAEALAVQGLPVAAAEEYATAVELEPDDASLRLALAETYIKAQAPAKAKGVLEELLKRDAEQPRAKELLESLK
jgi:tetratricopeptide (TPR) repeat protein